MTLFQHSVIKKYLSQQEAAYVKKAYKNTLSIFTLKSFKKI